MIEKESRILHTYYAPKTIKLFLNRCLVDPFTRFFFSHFTLSKHRIVMHTVHCALCEKESVYHRQSIPIFPSIQHPSFASLGFARRNRRRTQPQFASHPMPFGPRAYSSAYQHQKVSSRRDGSDSPVSLRKCHLTKKTRKAFLLDVTT
jgi:hypothetical protein